MNTILRDLKSILKSRYFLILSVCLLVFLGFILFAIGSTIVKQDIPFLEAFYKVCVEFLPKPLVASLQPLAITIGFWRTSFHPSANSSYCKWLATTPWTTRHPLPLGPWYPVPADYLVLGSLSAVSCFVVWGFNLSISLWLVTIGPFLLFSSSLAILWTLNNFILNQIKNVYLTISIPVLAAVIGIPDLYLIYCPVMMALISGYGVRCSLESFPWNEKYLNSEHPVSKQKSFNAVGWPYENLLHAPQDMTTTKIRAMIEALIAGSWTGLFLSWAKTGKPEENLSNFMMLIGIGAVLLCWTRIGVYSSAICDQLCYGQRKANKRWIIPAHDIIFLVPVLIVLIGTTLPAILYLWLGISLPIACGLTVAIVVFLARGIGPSVEQLHLTGVHSKFGTLGSQATKNFITTSSKNS